MKFQTNDQLSVRKARPSDAGEIARGLCAVSSLPVGVSSRLCAEEWEILIDSGSSFYRIDNFDVIDTENGIAFVQLLDKDIKDDYIHILNIANSERSIDVSESINSYIRLNYSIINSIFVPIAARRFGIGSNLMNSCKIKANRKYEGLLIPYSHSNRDSLNFYQNSGFKDINDGFNKRNQIYFLLSEYQNSI